MDGFGLNENLDQESMACSDRWPGEKEKPACF